jgi:hypothetical protein
MIPAKSKRKELLALPVAEWGNIGWWDSLLIVPTKRAHDSGYAHIAIIGCKYVRDKLVACQILAFPDDIAWPDNHGERLSVRTDAFVSNQVLHLWSARNQFSIDSQTSSVTIKMRKK